ncbi:hypothetical protein PUNSTDRAFT_131693 [Punctularia strigosozonata HHB-11173 SS5]|uniref:uncharacterized protein n=1 Tax=Punctularia strigosozonata (strain HHB-11173) TaxID=741275 RepID=UPI0004417DB8|nr:uncharacterized protein PUNSTDRAFT_131693 [Punctularia strigosozonata HHB-11173 SS5]EIN11530.1 hypothetical protein PUNSTDRAFT_131693 [Punctularia strigosozonata HHB-11173 SS5]
MTPPHHITFPVQDDEHARCACCLIDFIAADRSLILTTCGLKYHTVCFQRLSETEEKCEKCGEPLSKKNKLQIAGLAAAGVVGGVLLAPIVAPAALGLVGFGAAGPVAGGIAAGIQAGIGNVAAGSLFAACQSVAMGGALPATWAAIGGLIGGGAAAGAAAANRR